MTTTTIIEARVDDDEFVTDYGMIDVPRTRCHTTYSRPCIHAPEPFPRVIMFSKTYILRCNFQPIVFVGHSWPCIVRRNASIVTISVDVVGPSPNVLQCNNNPRTPFSPAESWVYELHAVKWWDEQDVDDSLLLGVWVD